MGMGIITRDHEGRVVAAWCATKTDVSDPASAEALAAWNVAVLSHRLGLRKVIAEGDALEVVNALKTDGK